MSEITPDLILKGLALTIYMAVLAAMFTYWSKQ